MDTPSDQIIHEAERFSPSKQTPQRGEVAGHPHGLTAKHKGRRQSLHTVTGSTEVSASKRLLKTCPRPQGVITDSEALSKLGATKLNLGSRLQTVVDPTHESTVGLGSRPGSSPQQWEKENSTGKGHFRFPSPLKYVTIDPQSDPVSFSSPIRKTGSKRKNGMVEATRKTPRLSLVPERDGLKHPSTWGPSQSNRSPSIHSLSGHSLSNNSPVHHSLSNNFLAINTPQRITHAVNISPENDQHSRIMDDSALMLDPAQSPEYETATSPLHNHSAISTTLEHRILPVSLTDSEEEEARAFGPVEVEGDESSEEGRPVFSILQLKEIQAIHSRDTEDLQARLASRTADLIRLNKQVVEQRAQLLDQEVREAKETARYGRILEEVTVERMRVSEAERRRLADRARAAEATQAQESKLEAVRAEASAVKAECEALQAAVMAAEAACETARAKAATAVSATAEKTQALNETISELQATLEQRNLHLENLEQERANQAVREQENSKQLRALEDRLDAARANIQSLENTLAAKELEAAQGALDLEALVSASKEAAEKLERLAEANATLASQVGVLEAELAEERRRQAEVKEELERAQNEADEFKLERDQLEKHLAQQRDTYEQEIADLEDEAARTKVALVDAALALAERQAAEGKAASAEAALAKATAAAQSAAESFRLELASVKAQLAEQETATEAKLQQLAQDLYVQYSQKHEQKVAILRKGYETKWNGKLNNLEFDNKTLKRELESLKVQMENERNEKNQLVKLWDQFVEMEGDDDKVDE